MIATRWGRISAMMTTPASRAFSSSCAIRERPDVQDVFVELRHYDGADEWPHSDTVFIITSEAPDAVERWVEELHPDEVSEGWNVRPGIKNPLIESQFGQGMHVYRVWWD